MTPGCRSAKRWTTRLKSGIPNTKGGIIAGVVLLLLTPLGILFFVLSSIIGLMMMAKSYIQRTITGSAPKSGHVGGGDA